MSKKYDSDSNYYSDLLNLQKAVRELLYNTLTAGNGGYVVNFGPVLFGRLARLTNYDTNKRRINNE
jgi:hypothetical protein